MCLHFTWDSHQYKNIYWYITLCWSFVISCWYDELLQFFNVLCLSLSLASQESFPRPQSKRFFGYSLEPGDWKFWNHHQRTALESYWKGPYQVPQTWTLLHLIAKKGFASYLILYKCWRPSNQRARKRSSWHCYRLLLPKTLDQDFLL